MTNDDYTFMENPMSENWAVHVKTGVWEGVQFAFGKIGLRELPDKTGATLQFTYAILDACDFDQDVLKCDNDFNNHVGDILSHILDDSIQNNKFSLGTGNERTDAVDGS